MNIAWLNFKIADVSVVPSLFEPFGIVALEAMAAKSPCSASDTGGLSEIVDHDVTGVKVYPNNPDSLAWGISKILLDPNFAKYIRENAYQRVQEKYDWEKIAQQTKHIYEGVLGEYSKSFWANSKQLLPNYPNIFHLNPRRNQLPHLPLISADYADVFEQFKHVAGKHYATGAMGYFSFLYFPSRRRNDREFAADGIAAVGALQIVND